MGRFCLYGIACIERIFLREHSLYDEKEVRWSEDNIFSAVMGYYCGSFYYMRGRRCIITTRMRGRLRLLTEKAHGRYTAQ